MRSVDRVAYRPRQRVLLVARLECRLAAGSRLRNGDKRRSRVLWAVREPTSASAARVWCYKNLIITIITTIAIGDFALFLTVRSII